MTRRARAVRTLAALTAVLGLGACAGPAAVEAGGLDDSPVLVGAPEATPAGRALLATLADVPGRARLLDAHSDAYALAELVTPDSGTVWVQTVRLAAARVEQVLGDVDTALPAAESAYAPGVPSRRLRPLAADSLVDRVRACSGALAVVNAAFFEDTSGRPTPLSFPLKTGGVFLSGGSSPFGPGQPGIIRRRWAQPLRALVLAGDSVRTETYRSLDAEPLASRRVAEAIVSYAPSAHPGGGRATRFVVAGPLRPTDVNTETGPAFASGTLVLLSTGGGATLAFVSDLATRLGVPETAQVALDGGGSVLVWNRAAGTLARPSLTRRLPHALAVRLRSAPAC